MTLTQQQLHRLHIEDGLIRDGGAEGAEDRAFRSEVRVALMPADVPTLVPEVMAAIGAEPLGLAEAIREAAGAPPSLWGPVADAIGAPQDVLGEALRDALISEAEAPLQARHAPRRTRWPWFALAGVAAAAAAAVGIVLLEDPERMAEPVAVVMAPVTKVAKVATAIVPSELPGVTIIESLESETASVLQVLQFDDDAPTIIFIDDESGE